MNLPPISLTTSHQRERTGKENRVQVFLARVLLWAYSPCDYLVLKIRFSMNSNDIEPEQVVHTHWTSRRSSWPRGFDLIPVLTPEYLLPVSVDSSPPSYLFTSATVRLHQSVKQNLSDTWRSIFGFGAAQFRSVTEMAPRSPFLCANRSPIQYDFRAGAKVIPYCVNIAYGPVTD